MRRNAVNSEATFLERHNDAALADILTLHHSVDQTAIFTYIVFFFFNFMISCGIAFQKDLAEFIERYVLPLYRERPEKTTIG